MKKRNALATLCFLSVLASAMASCGKGDPEEGADDSSHLHISMCGIQFDSLQTQSGDTKKIVDFVQNKFNVTFDFINMPAGNWKTVLNTYMASGEIPDIFFHTRYEPAFTTWVEDGSLFDFSTMLENYPNLSKAFDRYGVDTLKGYFNGGLYGYPVVMDDKSEDAIINEHAMFYRRDWYQALVDSGYKPTSGRALVDPEDASFNYLNFYDLVEGFTLGDPDGNGVDDTYGYALPKEDGVYWWYPVLSMFGVIDGGWHYDSSSSSWVSDETSDEMKQAVYYLADMYDHGYINPSYATTCAFEVMKNEVVTGKAGMCCYNASYPMGQGFLTLMDSVQASKKNEALSDCVRAMDVPTGIDGKKHMFGYGNFYGYQSINNDISEAKKKRILSIMEWMLSEEGSRIMNYGLENIHWKYGEDGSIVSLLGNNDDGYPKILYDYDVAYGIYYLKGLVSWCTPISPSIRYYEEQIQCLDAWSGEDELFMDPLFYVAPPSDCSTTIGRLENIKSKAFKKIVNTVSGKTAEEKKASRDAIWDGFVANYNNKGADYFKAMNEAAKKAGK